MRERKEVEGVGMSVTREKRRCMDARAWKYLFWPDVEIGQTLFFVANYIGLSFGLFSKWSS